MALHIFAYNLHLKVGHAVCNNHFNKVPLTVNIHIHGKYVEVVGISIQKHMGVHTAVSVKQFGEIRGSFLTSSFCWSISHKKPRGA